MIDNILYDFEHGRSNMGDGFTGQHSPRGNATASFP